MMKIEGNKILLSVAQVALITFISMGSGKAGARVVISLAKDYLKKRRVVKTKSKLTEQQFRQAFSRLERDGLLLKEGRGQWRIAESGKAAVEKILATIGRRTTYPQAPTGPTSTIVIFDIPEKKHGSSKRALVRAELRALEFKPLQKSVWIGSAGLPKECISYFQTIEVLRYIHIFSINRHGTIA
jgi:DNA-binding transcriptional regulator PaaX